MEGGAVDTILKWDYSKTIHARFGLIRFSDFRGNDLKNQIKVNLAGMVLGWSPFNNVSISALLQIKMNSNFNCSYMAMSSLTLFRVFCEIFLSADLY
jgi:hypothetical protein